MRKIRVPNIKNKSGFKDSGKRIYSTLHNFNRLNLKSPGLAGLCFINESYDHDDQLCYKTTVAISGTQTNVQKAKNLWSNAINSNDVDVHGINFSTNEYVFNNRKHERRAVTISGCKEEVFKFTDLMGVTKEITY